MILTYLLYILFFGGIAVQLIYLLFIFTKLIRYRDKDMLNEESALPPISVVVAARNELENLKELLPLLEQQEYPNFQVVVADDRSSDGTHDFLINNKLAFPHLVCCRISDTPDNFSPKKYAMTVAIENSLHEIIVTTDADCRPASSTWLQQMVSQLAKEKDVVLGVSPYFAYPGLLNAFIRYETLQTAVQYLSFTLSGIPFMGVGRNLLFRKSLFRTTDGYKKHADLVSGDDDLFVNEATNSQNVAISVDKNAHVFSEPKHAFNEWVTQKRRHLSVGKKYKFKDKITIGLLWMSLLFSWLLFLPTMLLPCPFEITFPFWLTISDEWLRRFNLQHWLPFTNFMKLVFTTFAVWFFARWFILSKCNNRLDKFIPNRKIMHHDFLYTVYLLIFGCITLFSNPKKLKWK